MDKKINIVKLKKGSDSELIKLYEYLLPRLESFLKEKNVVEFDANEIVQDAIVRLHSNSERIYSKFMEDANEKGDIPMEKIAGYAYAIARNITYDKLKYSRNKKNLQEIYSNEFVESIEDEIIENEKIIEYQDLLKKALESLSPKAKKIIELKLAGYSYNEIADVLDAEPNHIRVASYRAMKALRNSIVHNINIDG